VSEPTIEIVPLEAFRPQRNNANKGTPRGLGMTENSMRERGAARSFVATSDRELFIGSQSHEAALNAGMTEALVVHSDGKRPVIVVRDDLTPGSKEVRKLAIEDNRAGQVGLDWDVPVLLDEPDLLAGLWYEDEADALMASLVEPKEAGNGGDEFDTTPAAGDTRVQPGDVWRVGMHRLMCGDSTKADDVARLMGGERAQAVVTDPPYGINREGITNDDPEGLRELFSGCLDVLPVDNAVIVAFQSPRLFPEWLDATRAAGHKFERMLWMYKPNDETFPWRGWLLKSEAILVSSIGKGQWNDVHPFMHDVYSPTTLGKELPDGIVGHHASVKPIAVLVDLVKRVSPDGAIVFDGFGGSGGLLIAAERTGRQARVIELEPRHCDLALRRAEAEGIAPIELVI
jgi:DNA modification methylase